MHPARTSLRPTGSGAARSQAYCEPRKSGAVLEIGSSLREARVGRGLELADVETATKIRARYLAALEDERFDILPGRAYAKAFLCTYARHLGLEEHLLVDEFDARLPPEEPLIVPPSRHRALWVPSPSMLLPLAVGLVFVALLAAGEFGSGTRSPGVIGLSSRPQGHAGQAPSHPAAIAARPRRARSSPKVARVGLTAARGDCWLLVRVDSGAGLVLYENTLTRGHSVSFARPRLWIRLGAPGNVSATLNGRPIESLPRNEHPTNILVSPRGARTV